jgi:hypothetical protein
MLTQTKAKFGLVSVISTSKLTSHFQFSVRLSDGSCVRFDSYFAAVAWIHQLLESSRKTQSDCIIWRKSYPENALKNIANLVSQDGDLRKEWAYITYYFTWQEGTNETTRSFY